MRRRSVALAGAATAAAFAAGAAALVPNATVRAVASSHRESPAIANDPTADLTDLYAFPSPDRPGTTTIIANVIPIEVPAEGPNYYNLNDRNRYRIYVDNTGDGKPELTFTLRTHTKNTADTFLYTTGQVTTLNDPDLAVKQTWSLYMQRGTGRVHLLGNGTTAPNNIGPKSFPDYAALWPQAVRHLQQGIRTFVGPREDPFFIDVGRIFDLLAVGGKGTDNLAGVGVHSIALQVPNKMLRRSASDPVIGVWSGVDERAVRVQRVNGNLKTFRWWKQVERLGQPLINEVIIPRPDKDRWNSVTPAQDAQFEHDYTKPALVHALNTEVLKPILQGTLGASYSDSLLAQESGRADLSAILLRGFNYGNGALDLTFHSKNQKPVDELRLNTNVPATPSALVDRRGLLCNFQSPADALGGVLHSFDTAPCTPAQFDGYPNGRRLGDDSLDIQIAALIGLPIPGLIPTAIQRPYALLAMGGDKLAGAPSPLNALQFGADGVTQNDANGGKFADTFPYVLQPNPGHS